MPICFGEGVAPIIGSYIKEEFESIEVIPKTNYRYWKVVDGTKRYID